MITFSEYMKKMSGLLLNKKSQRKNSAIFKNEVVKSLLEQHKKARSAGLCKEAHKIRNILSKDYDIATFTSGGPCQ